MNSPPNVAMLVKLFSCHIPKRLPNEILFIPIAFISRDLVLTNNVRLVNHFVDLTFNLRLYEYGYGPNVSDRSNLSSLEHRFYDRACT